ncbi:MAG: BamA/TamA family outer membrane protein [Nitrospira sp.]|jgi:outer membrane protein assembly factor BamA|nr:BamA/TamA family outer membrane protein [Nitrospira sp.]MBP6605777.1 BamA/TamA family outer membrane protein [Nitrospira sp.]MCI1277954.1 BamA/TamA family outer membrane protein [Nitrospira sp.]HQY56588.1 BamA/TamA family outer membrane protein [Nitrospira sp.]HRA96995.1 BamA/TamA family outer membrane protein [Nitrospira sp.]
MQCHHFSSIRICLALAGLLFLSLPAPAEADTQIFPVPSISTSRNDGNDAGLIAPILITNPDGELKYLMAPMLIQNSIVGTRGVFNLFKYEPGGRQMRFIASLTERIERKVLFDYVDPAFGNGQYYLNFGGTFFKNATSRFFGLGQSTVQADESNYTAREARAYWRLGLYANEVTQISVGQRVRQVRLQRGGTDLPFSVEQFPAVDGIQGESIIVGHRASFHYDTRDSLVTPTDGLSVMAYAELNQNIKNGDHPVYSRYELEVKKLFPSESKRAILVIRADLQATIGSQVPFFEQSSLGGQNNLRGFGLDRYIDKHLIAFSIEERIHLLRTKLAGVTADFEVAPFLDTGQVFNSFKDVSFQDYRMTPGLGFRAIVRPNVVGRVDYGYSREGGAVFAGLDFPY